MGKKTIFGFELENKLLNIRINERSKVWALFFQNFFEGLGSAFLYTIAISVFNANNQVHEFAYMLIGAGLITIAIGPVYEYIEHRLRTDKLLYGIAFFIIALLLVSVYFVFYTQWHYAGVALLIIHNLVYFFSNIQFWGMSALIFDVRESKRIFSIVGSGDLPAKFLGYSLVVPLTSRSDIFLFEFLIIGAILAYVASMWYLRKNIRAEKSILQKSHHDHRGDSKVVQVTRLFENKLIRSIAGMAVFATFVFFLLEFAFLKDIMHDLEHSDKGIARQLAIVMGLTYGAATLLKLFVSARYLQKLNMRVLLYSFPVVIILTGVLALLIDPYIFKEKPLYLAFIVLFIVGFIIRDAFYKPLSLSLYQPLAREKRLHGHNVVKGLAEPVGMVAVGVVFLVLYSRSHNAHLDFKVITYVLAAAILLWFLTSEKLVNTYREALTNLINRKLFNSDRFLLMDKSMESALIAKLNSGNSLDVLYALRMLKASNADVSGHLEQLMHHPHEEIRSVARNLFITSEFISQDRKMAFIRANVHSDDNELRLFCLLHVGKYGEWPEVEQLMMVSGQQGVYALLKGWSMNTRKVVESTIRGIINSMVNSGDILEKKMGIQLMKHYPSDEYSAKLMELMREKDLSIVRSAIRSSATMLNDDMLSLLIELLPVPGLTSEVQELFRKAGPETLIKLKESVTDSRNRLNFKLISVIGNHHHPAGRNLLIELLNLQNPDLREFTLGFTQLKSVKLDDVAGIRDLLGKEIRLLDMINGRVDGNLGELIKTEQTGGLRRMFKILALIADAEAVSRAQIAYFSGNKELKANAIETMSMVLPSNIFLMVRPYLELYPQPEAIANTDRMMSDMLAQHHRFYDWTIAMLINLRSKPLTDDQLLDLKNRHSQIINEQMDIRNNITMSDSLNLHLLEKVILLKQTPLFAETPENILLDIAEISEDVDFSKDEIIFNKGDEGDCLYIIYSGQCAVFDEGHLLATLQEKDFFGDLALLDPEPRSATVKAVDKVQLLRIGQHAIYELMSDRIEVARGIIKVLCRRLRNQNLKFTEAKTQLDNG